MVECKNCGEQDQSLLVGGLCKACIAGGVTLKGDSILMNGKVISGPKIAKVAKSKKKKK